MFAAESLSSNFEMKKFLIKIIKIGLFLALFTPFVFYKNFYFPYVGPKSLYFMAMAEMVFFAWIVLAKKYPEYRPRFKGMTLFLFLFLAVMSLSALFGVNPSLSFWSKFERMTGVLMWLHLFGFYLAASSVMQKKDWSWLFGASAGLGVLMGLLALMDKDPTMGGAGTIGNDSFLGTYLLFNIFFAVYLFLSQKWQENKPLKIFAAVAFFMLALCLLLEGTQFIQSITAGAPLPQIGLLGDVFGSGARAAKISFLAGMSLLEILWLAAGKNIVRRIFGLTLLLILFLGTFSIIILSTRAGNPVYQKMVDKFGESTLNTRLVVWKVAYGGFLDRPWLGSGPENFEYAFIQHYDPCFGRASGKCGESVWFDRAHNIILDTLVETGVLGLLSYLAIFVAAIFFLWKGFFRNKIGFAEAGVITSLFVAYFVQNLTVFDMVASLMLLALVLAFIESMLADRNKEKKEGTFGSVFVFSIVAAFLVCFFQFIVNPASAGHSVIVAVNSPFGSVARLNNYRTTIELSPMGRYQIRQFFAQTFINEEKKGEMTAETKIKELELLTGELQKSVSEVPLDYKSFFMLSQLYNDWASFDNSKTVLAEAASEKMIALSPTNQKGYWLLAQVRLYQNRINEAYDLAKKAYDLDPDNLSSVTIMEKIKAIRDAAAVPSGKK